MTDSEQIVYISCVEEVRYSFVSHLAEALRQIGINDLFVDSDDLLSEEAQAKVERARVAVMVLPGFLDKLDKVLKCQKNKDQVVIPVVYGVSSSRSDSLGALDSRGLTVAHQSRKECTDSKLVEEIVRDVYQNLFYMEQIGIYSKLLEIENMVCKQPLGIRRLGIWGMPGIGKTTLAKAVFDQMSGDFDACCFIEDYERVIREKGLYRLLEEQFSVKKPGAGGSVTKLSLLSIKLNKKRVLVVLDDVRSPLIVEPLFEVLPWLGPESLIIITSRDKQVFRLCRVNQKYEVQGLNDIEALQLFLLSASIKDKEEQNLHHELSMKVIECASGNPLALSIYGRELKGKKKLSEMETAFLELKRHPPFKIVDAFKRSYDSLKDSEKNIFLDIACFFNGENVDYVMQLLDGCGFFPHVGVDVLVGKSLMTVSENCVRMHNLIQDVGRAMVQIERRSRLWEPWRIKYLLEDDEHKANEEPNTTIKRAQRTKEIEGMFLDTSNLSFDVKASAFENMLNLRLLKIYRSNPEIHSVVSLSKGFLHSLPNELRLLHWENYPLRFLPPNFEPRRLVEINMPYSQLETLWVGTKNLEMLRTIRLCHSQQLVDVGDLSKAQNLEVVDLQGCTKLQSFPATGKLQHLRDINLSGCTEMTSFPDVPPNIETLHLQGTGITELPHSIVKPNGGDFVSLAELEGLSDALKLERIKTLMKMSSASQDSGKLICLDLKDCSRLQSLPNMINLKLLTNLDISGCSKLETIEGFPQNLKELYLAGTAVRHVPQLPQSLELFNAHGCVSLKSIRLDSKKLPMHYTFSNCFDLPPYMVSNFLVEALANARHIPRERQQELNRAPAFSFCSPSHADQNSALGLQPGSSVMTRLNPSWRKMLVGFAMLVEVAFSEDYCDVTGLGIRCVCRWKTKEGCSQRIERNLQCWAPGKAVPKVQKDHIFVFVDVNMCPSTDEGNDPDIWADLVVFEFFPASKQTKLLDDGCKVTRCGIRVISAPTGNTSREDISPALALDPMEVSVNEDEEVLRASYRGLQEMNKALFLYIACLFNDEDVDLVAPFNAGTELDVGLKVLADTSLIRVSPNGEIVMHCLLRRIGKELLLSESILPGSSKKIERLVDDSQSYMINARKIENPENMTRDLPCEPITLSRGLTSSNNQPNTLLSQKRKGSTMASSSSSVGKISKGPQVFINFLGKELRKSFIVHLEDALEEADINFFIDKHEQVGTKLQNLLVRIEQSRVALVIFSKDYTSSERCLDELVKIKECMDKGSLIGVPIFYKLETSIVSNLEGHFGENFRTLQRKNQHDVVKTQKWEEALTSTSQRVGIHLSESSDQSDREFIESIVKEVKSLLDNISLGEKPDQKRHKVNRQCSIHMMKEDLDALQKTIDELKDGRDDLLVRVAIEEDKGFKRLAKVKRWLEKVESVIYQVNDLREARSTEIERLCPFGYCSDNCIKSNDYGKEELKRLMEEVKELLSKGDFNVVAQKSPVPKAEEKPIQTTVGLDTKVEMAWKSLMKDERRILGLYGMGGVGKTTLLSHINKKFVEVENEFNVVIWVVVSKEFQNEGIQDQILRRLLVGKEWKHGTEKEKASLIKNILERIKFVLLLDDLWSEIDLNKIGVPAPTQENGSKIVLTTRSKDVCKYMKADEQIKVDCLSPEEAWELFQITIGDIPLRSHHDFPALARIIVEKCCGLPLALTVIGKTMACKEDVHEWRYAIIVLNSAGREFPDMKERILPILKFSYDSLKESEVKSCFQYCSLFPEDFEIEKEKLIEYWICEGFINGNRYEDGGIYKGYDIIGLLVRAHLLIDCGGLEGTVKMHDVIREMALWIESGFGKQQETICVKSGEHVRLIPNGINWEILRRMSIMWTQIEEISCSPNCPNLSILLLSNNDNLVDISGGFFRLMPQLVVLDLSRNRMLYLLEDISNLGSLQYLNLSKTDIQSLPVGLKNLRKLIFLNLENSYIRSLAGIATNLPNLQVLKLYGSYVCVDDILMEELERLEHLKVLTVNIKDAMILERIQGFDRLARIIRGLRLLHMSAPLVVLNSVALRGLQRLKIRFCNISEIKIEWKSKERRELSPVDTTSPGFHHLSHVVISWLDGQKDLSWLLFAQNLRTLTVGFSPEIEEIINKEKGMSITKDHPHIALPFQNLEYLNLLDLDGLREICWNYPNLPNCKSFEVKFCPKLPKE